MPRVKTESYHNRLLTALKNPEEAAHYLNACLEDSDPRVFLLALRDVADAHGGISHIASGTRLNRESLYRMLSRAGNPSLHSLSSVLRVVGLRLSVRTQPSRRGKGRRQKPIARPKGSLRKS